MRLKEIAKTIKPITQQQSRIDALKRQKDNATQALKAERARQKIAKAQQHIAQVNQSIRQGK